MSIKQQGGIFGRNPTFNNVTVDGDLSVAGGVDLGAAPVIGDGSANASLTINKGASSTGTVFFQQNSLASGYIQYDAFERFISQSAGSSFWRAGNTADKLELTTTGDFKVNAGNLVISTSGKGIDFSATSGTGTSELFDDYEEGTWTPTFGNLTLGDGVSTGTYTKIGDTVTIYGKLVLGSTTTVDGVLSVTNLPFSAASGFNPIGNMRLLDQGTNSFAAQVSVNTTSLTFRSAVANSTYLLWGQVNATNPFTWAPTDQIEFNAVYKAA